MTYKKGHPGGPGRPRGSRNKATLLLEAVNRESLTRALRALGKKAEDGDIAALKLLLPAWLRQAGDFVDVDLPRVVDAASLAEAQAVLIGLVAGGQLGIEQADRLSALLENRRRALETSDTVRLLHQTQENLAERDRRDKSRGRNEWLRP